MPRIVFVLRDGQRIAVDAESGMSVMEVALNAGVRGINADCGGECQCATCHVYLDDTELTRFPPASETERDMLEGVAAPLERGSRLSCQLTVTDTIEDIVVRIPYSQ